MAWVGEGTQVELVVVVEEGTLVVVAAAAMLVVIGSRGTVVVEAAALLDRCEVVVSATDSVVDEAAVVLEADGVPVGVTTEGGKIVILPGVTREVWLITNELVLRCMLCREQVEDRTKYRKERV